MLKKIKGEPKYALDTETGQLVNKSTGTPIPDDEPVMIFRAQDMYLPLVLARYIELCEIREHRLAIGLRLAEVLDWQVNNPLRVKQPDTVLDLEWPKVARVS